MKRLYLVPLPEMNDQLIMYLLFHFLQERVSNLLTPITVAATFDYNEPSAGCDPYLCPVPDVYTKKTLTEQVCVNTKSIPSFAKCLLVIKLKEIHLKEKRKRSYYYIKSMSDKQKQHMY